MSQFLKQFKNESGSQLFWLIASVVWTFVLIIPLIYIPLPKSLTGLPWKVELFFSFFLGAALIILFRNRTSLFGNVSLKPDSFGLILLPGTAFIVWSGFSAIWANSPLSVFHHTAIWVCYLGFLFLAIGFVKYAKYRHYGLASLSIVVGVIAMLCVIEYISATQIVEKFTFRYGRFAEVFAATLPLFFSYTLRLKKSRFVWSFGLLLLMVSAILFSQSRAAFLASLCGIAVFSACRLISKPGINEFIKGFAILAVLAGAGYLMLTLFSASGEKITTISRLTEKDKTDVANTAAKNVRFMIWGVTKEMFLDNKLLGVGADNYGLEFNRYRSVFAAKSENLLASTQSENEMPERAHNELFQVFAELGIVGGILFILVFLGVFKLGIEELFYNRKSSSAILSQAAFAGLVTFLLCSLFSSFSFRLLQNGLVFFFFAAILLRNRVFILRKYDKTKHQPRLNFLFILAAIVCLSLTVYSGIRGLSQYYVYLAEQSINPEISEGYYKTAMALEPGNSGATFSYGTSLMNQHRFAEAEAQLRKAVDKGVNTSIAYSTLCTSQILGGNRSGAKSSFEEALRIYPNTYFQNVRYASFLRESDPELSQKYLAIAKKLDLKHSTTWWLFINYGIKSAFEDNKRDENVLSLADLKPEQAISMIRFERETLHPEEKISFDPNN